MKGQCEAVKGQCKAVKGSEKASEKASERPVRKGASERASAAAAGTSIAPFGPTSPCSGEMENMPGCGIHLNLAGKLPCGRTARGDQGHRAGAQSVFCARTAAVQLTGLWMTSCFWMNGSRLVSSNRKSSSSSIRSSVMGMTLAETMKRYECAPLIVYLRATGVLEGRRHLEERRAFVAV